MNGFEFNGIPEDTDIINLKFEVLKFQTFGFYALFVSDFELGLWAAESALIRNHPACHAVVSLRRRAIHSSNHPYNNSVRG
jgi:hypothetical protein